MGPAVVSMRHTLVVRGDSGSDTVNVGAGSGGTVSVHDTSSTGGSASASASGVRHVIVLPGAGNNSVDYGQTGPLTEQLWMFVYLGGSTSSPSSSSTVSVDSGGSTGAGRLGVGVVGGAGPDTVSLTTSAAASATMHTRVTVVGGTGDTSVEASLTGNMVGAFKLTFLGGPGNDSVTFNSSLTSGATIPSVALHLFGGGGNDSIAINATESGSALLGIQAWGGSGNDTIAIDLAPQSTHSITAMHVNGGAGNDNLSLDLRGANPSHEDAVFLLGPGNDTFNANLDASEAGTNGSTLMSVISGSGANTITENMAGVQNHLLGVAYVLGHGNNTLATTVDLTSAPLGSAGGGIVLASQGIDQISLTVEGEMMQSFGYTILSHHSSVDATTTVDLASIPGNTAFGLLFIGKQGNNQNTDNLLGQLPKVIGIANVGVSGNNTFTTNIAAGGGTPPRGIGEVVISGLGNVTSATTFTGDVERGVGIGFYGGPGNDNLTASINLAPESHATVLSQIQGGIGQDTFGLTVNGNSDTDVIAFLSGSSGTNTLYVSPNVQLVYISSPVSGTATFITDSFAVLLGLPILVPASSATGPLGVTPFLPEVPSLAGPVFTAIPGTGPTFFVPGFDLVAAESGGSFLGTFSSALASPGAASAAILTPLNSGQAFLTVLANGVLPTAGGLQGGTGAEGVTAAASSTGGQPGAPGPEESLGDSSGRIATAPSIPFEEVRSAQELLGDVLLGPENLPGRGIAPPVLPDTGGQNRPGMEAAPSWIEFPIGIDPTLHRLPPAPPLPPQPGAFHPTLFTDKALAADALPSLAPPGPPSAPRSWRHLVALALGTATAWLAGTTAPVRTRMSARWDGQRPRGRGRSASYRVHGSE